MLTKKVDGEMRFLRACIAGLLWSVPVFALAVSPETQFSGPQPGESLVPFKVLQILSPEQEEEVEIANRKDYDTTVLMFMHKISEPAIGLMTAIEWYAAMQQDVTSHYIMLTDDIPEATSRAKRWAQRPFFSQSPMSVSLDGLEGPGQYGLNRHLDMTVLVAKNNKVVHNFALNGPNNTDAPEILAAIAETVGRPAPSYEKIRAELRAARQRRRETRLRENPAYKLAPNPELGRMMVAMIYREQATEGAVKELTAAMKQWAGDDEKKQASLAGYANKVLKGNFQLNRFAREALQELVDK